MTAASSAAPYCVLPDTVVNEQHYTDESLDHSRDRGPGDSAAHLGPASSTDRNFERIFRGPSLMRRSFR